MNILEYIVESSQFDVNYMKIQRALEMTPGVSDIRTADDHRERKILSKKYVGIDFKYEGIRMAVVGMIHPFTLEQTFILCSRESTVPLGETELSQLEKTLKEMK